MTPAFVGTHGLWGIVRPMSVPLPHPAPTSNVSGHEPILAIFSDLALELASSTLQGCAEALAPHSRYLTLLPLHAVTADTVHALRPCAILTVGSLQDLPGSRQALQAANIPVVETWSSPICARDCVVAPDNDHAGRLAAQHLAARGHKRVACVSGSSSWDTERRQGFLTQARQLELEIAAEIVQHDVRGVPDGRTAMLKLLATQTIFDAVFCTNDQLTIGVVSEAHDRELVIPLDLAVLGCSDTGTAIQSIPGLSAIRTDAIDLGRRAGAMLMDRLTGQQPMGLISHMPSWLETHRST
ncbi:substrate-binding domain-containing protein [Achromobacter xylosoxidans]|uniref:substrate-binding domain-containing protein n=2 Tax=Alcaligenes xylosoxydans xylosoxydans TaxID=85698 RepID=UPI0006845BB5|nr:substrate-binding domain-containing protein [Achromobacter xylosoxidans]MDZ5616474.1 substrate-binding domain-containing protein [Achromobacter xylosoxidans]MDZ5684066.1 substrate-binding domain-containing protein [Achromobacter xylosoxidans]